MEDTIRSSQLKVGDVVKFGSGHIPGYGAMTVVRKDKGLLTMVRPYCLADIFGGHLLGAETLVFPVLDTREWVKLTEGYVVYPTNPLATKGDSNG